MAHIIDNEHVKDVYTIKGDQSYKLQWTPVKKNRSGFRVFNRNLKGRILSLLVFSIVPRIAIAKKAAKATA